MKDWDDLQTMLALGRAGTMKGAATILGVSETTIARRIRKLSGDDISRLFSRDGQRWTPTSAGERLVTLAETIESRIMEADQLMEETDAALTGSLVISSLSFVNSQFIGETIARFQAEHPDLHITLNASDDRVSLAFREADIALRLARPTEGRLIGRRLCTVPMTAFAMGDAPFWVGLPTALDWTPEMQLGVEHFGAPPRLRIDSFEGVLRVAATSGCGGIAPSCMLTSLPEPARLLGEPRVRELWLTYHEDLRGSPKIRAVIDWLTEAYPASDRCLCGKC